MGYDEIANIALQVGFSSQMTLTQQFKRLTGVTPKQIRPRSDTAAFKCRGD